MESIIAFSTETLPPVFQGIWPSLVVVIGALITLGILTFLISYFAYFPTKEYLATRKKHIQNNIDSAAKLNTDAQKLFEQADKQVKDFEKTSNVLLEENKKEALIQKKEIVDQAKVQANKIIEESKIRIAQEEQKMKEKVSKDFIEVSLAAAEAIIKENLNSDKNKELIQEFIKDFEKNEINK